MNASPETVQTPRRTRRIFVLGVLVCVVLLAAAPRAVRWYGESQAQQEADSWRAQAQADPALRTSMRNARDWLQSHGFDVTIWNPHVDDGWIGARYDDDPQYAQHLIVVGERSLEESSWTAASGSIRLEILFDLDRTYKGVESEFIRSSR